MLQLHYNDWKAVRLKNSASVEYLNRLFADGWYLLQLDFGELRNLAFLVPLNDPEARDEEILVTAAGDRSEMISIIILTRGTRKGSQRAIVGAGRPAELRGWNKMAQLPLDEGVIITIYQQP